MPLGGSRTDLDAESNRHASGSFEFGQRNHHSRTEEIPYPDSAKPKRLRPWRSTDGNSAITVSSQSKTIFVAWANLLLVASFVGIILQFTSQNHAARFAANFLGIMPLTGLSAFAQEELGLKFGRTSNAIITGLFGTATELIVAIVALCQNQILVATIFLVGSLLFHLLLSLGLSLLFGGFKHTMKHFVPPDAWYSALQILFIVAGALAIPSAFDMNIPYPVKSFVPRAFSRGTAILLLVGYCCWMYAQTKQTGLAILPSTRPSLRRDASLKIKVQRAHLGQLWPWRDDTVEYEGDQPKEELDEHRLTFTVALITLLGSLTLLTVNSVYMVAAIDGITCDSSLSKAFLSVVILPGLRFFDVVTAVFVARRDHLSLAVTFILGDSLQIGLLVLPVCMLLSWSLNNDVGISSLPGYYATLLVLAAFFVLQLLNHHRSHWLGGLLAVDLWMVLAISTWYDHPKSELATCRG